MIAIQKLRYHAVIMHFFPAKTPKNVAWNPYYVNGHTTLI